VQHPKPIRKSESEIKINVYTSIPVTRIPNYLQPKLPETNYNKSILPKLIRNAYYSKKTHRSRTNCFWIETQTYNKI
jgi:hypothetical protein